MNAQRTLISLFGRNNQHVIAESTQNLSLQNDDGDGEEDENGLWLGCCYLGYERSFCKHVFDRSETGDAIVVLDMTQDDRFKEHRDVLEFPHVRFMASAPILSPKGHTIGAYTIFDDKPRSYLEPKYYKFLKEMARTVMGYLETTRAKGQHLRAERMLVGIGSFLEGKSSLRHAWLKSSESDQSPLADKEKSVEGHVNQPQQIKQVMATEVASKEKAACKIVHPNQSESAKHPNSGRPFYKRQDSESKPNSDRGTLSSRVSDAFSRAANVARESLEVEGVVYFDANFASYGGFATSFKNDSDFSGPEGGSDLSDDGKNASSKDIPMPTYDTEKWSSPCRMLSHSTTDSSSINQEFIIDRSIAMSEAMVGGLLRRYPRGKIFNFSEEGSISSDESTDGVFKDFYRRGNTPSNYGGKAPRPPRKYKKTRQATLLQDARALLQLAPGARSIIFTPLWDSHKNRWYSGCIAWTRTPYRVFTIDDELTYLFALGNSVMAEAHRLGAEYTEQAKTDLLSSLSHELRSPLHGVFGIAELLDDTLLFPSQQIMVHTIESCGRTLLDTINHLLQYARINHLQQPTPNRSSEWDNSDPSKSDGASNSSDADPRGITNASEHLTVTELDNVLEEVVESVFAGYAFLLGPPASQVPGTQTGTKQTDLAMGDLKIILDIDSATNWTFLLHPGRWRLILMEIFGNALKFTKKGSIHVALNASPGNTGTHHNPTESQITLTVSDTGIGIGKTYLNGGLFEAFSQENDLSHGTGLGLHVSHHTILSLGGDIQIQSRRGSGTEVIAEIDLDHPPELATHEPSVAAATRQLTHGRSIGILGLGDSEADNMLGSSLTKLFQDWFGMEVHCVNDASQLPLLCDYYLVAQEDMDLDPIFRRAEERLVVPVIVICSTPASASARYSSMQKKGDDGFGVVEYISQPCGPRKMARALKSCLLNQRYRHDLVDKKSEAIEPSPAITELPVRPATGEEDKVVAKGEDAKTDLSEVKVIEVKTPSFNAVHDQETSRDSKEESETGQAGDDPPKSRVPESVLIVDDNELNVRILEAYMKKLGYDHAVAQDGLEALEAFRADPERFKIILMGKLYTLTSHLLFARIC